MEPHVVEDDVAISTNPQQEKPPPELSSEIASATSKTIMTDKDLIYAQEKASKETLQAFRKLKSDSEVIKCVIAENASASKVQSHYSEWLNLYETFLKANLDYCRLLDGNDRDVYLEITHEPRDTFIKNFKVAMENWFISQAPPAVLVRGGVSQKSGSDRLRTRCSHGSRSSTSSRASARMKEEQKKAELLERKKTMKIKRDIELAKLQLKLEEEELSLNTEIAIANARSKILETFDQCDAFSSVLFTDNESNVGPENVVSGNSGKLDTCTTKYVDKPHSLLSPIVSPFIPAKTNVSTAKKVSVVSNVKETVVSEDVVCHDQKPEDNVNSASNVIIRDHAVNNVLDFRPEPQTEEPVSMKPSFLVPTECTLPCFYKQTSGHDGNSFSEDVTSSFVRHLRKPAFEIRKFGGNPMEFRKFLRQFHAKITANTDSEDEKMNYLEQYTVGEANKVVSGFSHLDASFGFPAAIKELEDRYGDSQVIASSFIKKALEWPMIKPDDTKTLDEFALFLVECKNAVASIEALKVIEYSENMKRINGKLPYFLHDRWRSIVQQVKSRNDILTFDHLVQFVKTEARKANDPLYGREALFMEKRERGGSSQKPRPVSDQNRSKGTFATNAIEDSCKLSLVESTPTKPLTEGKSCNYCSSQQHTLQMCQQFRSLPYPGRVEYLKSKGICFGCLGRGHMVKKCKTRLTCSKCNMRHPTALHDSNRTLAKTVTGPPSNVFENKSKSEDKSSVLGVCSHAEAGDGECTMAIIPVQVRLKNGLKSVQTYAFLDPGSSITFCTDRLLHKLGGSGHKMTITLDTMGASCTMNTSAVKGLQVCDLQFENSVDLPTAYTKEEMPVSQVHIPKHEDVAQWSHLQDISMPQIDAPIDLLIGNNVPDAYSPTEISTGPRGSPHATRTLLGWVVWNVVRTNQTDHSFPVNRIEISALKEAETLKKLDRLVRNSINLDFPESIIDDIRQNSQEDKKFIEQVEASIHTDNGHYSIELPFRCKDIKLPNNKMQAVQRLSSLEKKLRRNQQFQADYKDFMSKVLAHGYAEQVPEGCLDRCDGRVWYIPHHGVYHPKKPGKIRVVFDCAAAYSGVSLNQVLLQGPDLTNSLLGVLIRFRQEQVAVIGDIESMYYQVRVPRNDCDCMRFLWWPDGDLSQEPVDYRMLVHLFGATSSPSCANFALRRTADDNPEFDASAIEAIRSNFYVDDCLASRPTEEEALSLVSNITSLCAKGGFRLTKWMSNSRSVLESIPVEERHKEIKQLDLETQQLPNERVLGVSWFIESDTLGFKIQIPDKTSPTRRVILSVVSSVFDPLGFAAPFILVAKGILQELCRNNVGWDKEITDHNLMKWQRWLQDLHNIEKIVLPRCFKPCDFEKVVSCQIHNFADASNHGYGMVSYLRLTDESGQVTCSFLQGKARVAPLKKITIPRLELTAATMAVRLSRMIVKELDYTVNDVFFWTDSMTTLRYIANESSRFHTFVANRVAVIREGSDVKQWRYVPSHSNPADHASRGLPMMKFLSTSQWFNGPDFLWEHDKDWPKQQDVKDILDESDLEVKKVTATTLVTPCPHPIEVMMQHFSSWTQLKKAVAWMLVFRRTLLDKSQRRKNGQRINSPSTGKRVPHRVTVGVLQDAEMEVVRYVQTHHFPAELRSLEASGRVMKSSALRKLDPLLVEGVIRVGGRLAKAQIPFDAKHPILLPKESPASTMILEGAHKSVGHLGRNAILAAVQQKYWIVGANSAIKKIVSKCVTCRRYQGPTSEQKMADLPSDRLIPEEAPFTRVGMDFFGPFEVRRGRSMVKRYGVLFTCLAIRAVHIEIAHSLDTDSCIHAVRRFIARRGPVRVIRSDNGTNIVGAEREMREEIHRWNNVKIKDALLNKNISWDFNPPTASHQGGVWERLIRSIRKVMYSLLREQTIRLDDEALQTLMCEIEAILNGRPISCVRDSPNDLDALTPNHLLLLSAGENLPPGIFCESDNYVRRRWRQVQYLADMFWTRWVNEYLPILQKRQKWLYPRRNLSVGDVVLLVDNSPRNSWSLGKVLEVIEDKHGLVRSVKLKTKSSTLQRPTTKLCLLLEADS